MAKRNYINSRKKYFVCEHVITSQRVSKGTYYVEIEDNVPEGTVTENEKRRAKVESGKARQRVKW